MQQFKIMPSKKVKKTVSNLTREEETKLMNEFGFGYKNGPWKLNDKRNVFPAMVLKQWCQDGIMEERHLKTLKDMAKFAGMKNVQHLDRKTLCARIYKYVGN